jgi:hypothetical protein
MISSQTQSYSGRFYPKPLLAPAPLYKEYMKSTAMESGVICPKALGSRMTDITNLVEKRCSSTLSNNKKYTPVCK